jgi:hypothetical protein
MKPNRASGCPRLLSRRGEDKAGLQFGGEVSVQVGTWGKAVGLNMSTILRKCNTKFRLLHSVQGEKNVLLETELKKRICHIVSDCTSSQVLLFDLTSHNPNHLKKNPKPNTSSFFPFRYTCTPARYCLSFPSALSSLSLSQSPKFMHYRISSQSPKYLVCCTCKYTYQPKCLFQHGQSTCRTC